MKRCLKKKPFILSLLGLFIGVSASSGQTPTALSLYRSQIMQAAEWESFRRYDLAAELYVRLSQTSPADMAAYSGARRCLLELHQYARLEQHILQLQKHHRHVQFEVDLAEILHRQGQAEEAVRRWLAIVDSNPMSTEAYTLIGATLETHELWKEALFVYETGRRRFKAPWQFALEISQIRYQLGEYEKSGEELCLFLAEFPGQATIVQSQFLNQANERAAFSPLVKSLEKEIKKDGASAARCRQILVALYTQAKEYEVALQQVLILENAADKSPQRPAVGHYIFTLGTTALRDSAYAPAREAFTLLLATFPTSPYAAQAELSLATLYEAQKDYRQAISAFEKFIARHQRSDQVLVALTHIGEILFYRLFDLAAAEKVFEQILQTYPQHAYRFTCLYRLGEIALAKGDINSAVGYFSKITGEAAGSTESYRSAQLALAQMDFFVGRPSLAEKRLKRLLALQPGSEPNKVENDALQLLVLLTENRQDSLGLATLGAARLDLLQHRYDQAVERLQAMKEAAFPEAQITLVDALRRSAQPERAVVICETLWQSNACLQPDRVLLMLAEIYDRDLKDLSHAQTYYEALLEKYPQSIYIEQARQRVRDLDQQLHKKHL